jgi:CHASE3 domain sensor protein
LPLTGIAVSLAILAFAEFGYMRLDQAQRRMAAALETETLLNEILTAVVDAETGQRGYLLTGREEYLEPYHAALPRLEELYQRLRARGAIRGDPETRHAGRLNALVGKKLAELEAALALHRRSGPDAALELLRTDLGRRSMESVRVEAGVMAGKLRAQLSAGSDRWYEDISIARIGMQLMTRSRSRCCWWSWYSRGASFTIAERDCWRYSRKARGTHRRSTADLLSHPITRSR